MDTTQVNLFQNTSIPNSNSNNIYPSIRIIQNNPFRVLGLYAESTEREIAKQVNNLLTYIDIGKTPTFIKDISCLTECSRTKESIDEARRQIEQREYRLFYSFFWFSKADSVDEFVMEILAEGNFEKAIQLWEKSVKKAVNINESTYGHNEIENGIVDGLFIPFLLENYEIDNILSNDDERQDFIDLLRHYANETLQFMSDKTNDDTYTILNEVVGVDDNGDDIELNIVITRDNYENIRREISDMENTMSAKEFSHTKNLVVLYLALAMPGRGFYLKFFEKGLLLAGRLFSSKKSLRAYVTNIAGDNFNFEHEKTATLFIDEIFKSLGPYIDDTQNLIALKKIFLSLNYFPNVVRKSATDKLTSRWKKPIENEIADAKKKKNDNPAKANVYGLNLYNNTREMLVFLKDVLGESNLKYHHIADSVAEELISCSIAFYNRNMNDETNVDPGEDALKLAMYADAIAMSSQVKEKAGQGIVTIRKWVDDKPLRDRESKIKPHIELIIEKIKQMPDPDKAIHREINIAEIFLSDCKQPLAEWKKVIDDLFRAPNSSKINVPSVVILENFDDNENKWPENDEGPFFQKIDNKRYLLNNKSKEEGYLAWSLNNVKFSGNINFTLECSITNLAGKDSGAFGIVFGFKKLGDKQTYSTFRILDNGYYYGTFNSEWVGGLKWTASEYLLCNNETNILKIQKQNNKVAYFVNNNLIGEEDSIQLNEGSGIGFIVNSNMSIAVHYIYYCNDVVKDFKDLHDYNFYMDISSAVASRVISLCIAYANRTEEMEKPIEVMSKIQSLDMKPETRKRFNETDEIFKKNLSIVTPSSTSTYTPSYSSSTPYIPPHSSTISSSKIAVYWIFGVIALIIVIFMCDESNKNKSSYTPAPEAAPSVEAPVAPAPTPAPSYSSVSEEKPPIGAGNLFNRSQIRYCLSEGIRIDAMRGFIDQYSKHEVNQFNFYVNDHNGRCGSFRYRRGTLEAIRNEVENNRYVLEQEGIKKVVNMR